SRGRRPAGVRRASVVAVWGISQGPCSVSKLALLGRVPETIFNARPALVKQLPWRMACQRASRRGNLTGWPRSRMGRQGLATGHEFCCADLPAEPSGPWRLFFDDFLDGL